ncbi:MAG: hypothetical protein JWM71_598 [Solirubrobacteraceae bacterium]|nr:hypothetical protein [Solirubrobacteraceae bacterium]
MDITIRKLGVITGIAAAFALPATALADNGGGNGNQNDPSSAGRTETYQLRGTIISIDAATNQVVLKVTKTNHGGRGHGLVGQTLTFDVSGARVDVRDNNADGMRDLGDVTAGDSAEVRARLARPLPASFTGPIAAQRFKDRAHHDQAELGQDG